MKNFKEWVFMLSFLVLTAALIAFEVMRNN